ncbi:MAG: SpoIIE family protein phosphatase, partial [Actinomycetota bacterium]|nr:SpoIIE family protein phosphatase [Actinomycetota bacterium]
AEAIVASGEGRMRFNRIREEAQALRDALQGREEGANATLQQARRRLDTVLFTTFFAGLALLGLTASLTGRWITMPLRQISAAVRAVSFGDLGRAIPAPGPPDVAALGADAEQMRRRIVDELDTARRAEQALRSQGALVAALRDELAPTDVTLPAGLALAGALEPVSGVLAGDWYDVLPLGDDAVALSLIDVSGHGQDTGLFALQAKNLMVATMRQRLDPGPALAWLADALGDTGDLFLTTVLFHVSTATGRCRYASAGHLPPLLATADGVRRLAPTGPLLGPMPGAWDTAVVTLAPGDVLVVYTDGLTEARSADGEEFGEERLAEVVAATAALGPEAVVDACLAAVHGFAPGEATDDATIVAVARRD